MFANDDNCGMPQNIYLIETAFDITFVFNIVVLRVLLKVRKRITGQLKSRIK